MYRSSRTLFVTMIAALLLAACGAPAEQAAQSPTEAPAQAVAADESAQSALSQADLDAIKAYAAAEAVAMKSGSASLRATAEAYYAIIEAAGFDYQAAWDANSTELAALVAEAKEQWIETSLHYERNEGIVAGVPSLAYYDVWLDAGPSAEEDPEEALVWQLELPDGTVLDSPGNFFHHLTEPAIWATNPDYTGLAVDLDADGAVEFAEGLPEANIFLAAAQGLDDATAEMQSAIAAWEPTLSDAFTALAVMIPTMNEYFEQWKLSAFVAGNSTEEASFVAVSRLFDINGILHGLDLAYGNVGVVVQEQDDNLFAQIDSGLDALVSYVGALYEQEQSGKVFTAEEADLFGTEAQDQATAVAGQITQAAALLGVDIQD